MLCRFPASSWEQRRAAQRAALEAKARHKEELFFAAMEVGAQQQQQQQQAAMCLPGEQQLHRHLLMARTYNKQAFNQAGGAQTSSSTDNSASWVGDKIRGVMSESQGCSVLNWLLCLLCL
jgi:hypothetical protein